MTLTEQWKKGELEDGFYYVEEDGKTSISICRKHYLLQVLQDCKVLAPVPNFEDWKQLRKFLEEFNALDVAKENQQLKELLLDCRQKFLEAEKNYGFDDSIIDICDPIIEKIDNAIGADNDKK